MKTKQSWAERIKKRNRAGFSLVELVVVIAIMAIMTAVLAPSLLSYVERSRAQKDTSAMSEVVNSIMLALADQNVYDEVLCYTAADNVSCYVDSLDTYDAGHASYTPTKKSGDTVLQYMFDDDARREDENPYAPAGVMRGVTITFEPEQSTNKSCFVLYNGIINKFGPTDFIYGSMPETEANDDDELLLGGMASFGSMTNHYLYNRIRSTVGDKIELTSQTYRNSEYTVFIRMGTTGGAQADKQDAIAVYGQWNGTNLSYGNNGTQQGGNEGPIVTCAHIDRDSDNICDICSTASDFDTYSWGEIAAFCQAKNIPSTWAVGNVKEMEIDDQMYTIAIIGKNHDTYVGGGTAPLTFQVIDLVATHNMNSTDTNSGGWAGSAMYSYLNTTMLNSLPDDVKNNIQAVTKTTNIGFADATDETFGNVVTSSDKLFLLANVEVTGDAFWAYYNDVLTPYEVEIQMAGASDEEKAAFRERYILYCNAMDAEGKQYAYYAATGDVAEQPTLEEFLTIFDLNYWYSMSAATLEFNGSAAAWWHRSPDPLYDDLFSLTDETGTSDYYDPASYAFGVSFGFCF